MIYWVYRFEINPLKPFDDILTGELADLGFESFVNQSTGLDAFISEDDHSDEIFKSISRLTDALESEISFQREQIDDQNWNALWESEYPVVEIGMKCLVRAPFHEPAGDRDLEIIIEPQMSFGTGHHQTTFMVLSFLIENDVKNKSVLDMGSGTGVLAIAAKMKGAKSVKAVDIESWAYENTLHNARLNHVHIDVGKGDVNKIIGDKFDLILANINKNILLTDMKSYSDALEEKGVLLLSGFFQTDVSDIVAEAETCGMKLVNQKDNQGWAALYLSKST